MDANTHPLPPLASLRNAPTGAPRPFRGCPALRGVRWRKRPFLGPRGLKMEDGDGPAWSLSISGPDGTGARVAPGSGGAGTSREPALGWVFTCRRARAGLGALLRARCQGDAPDVPSRLRLWQSHLPSSISRGSRARSGVGWGVGSGDGQRCCPRGAGAAEELAALPSQGATWMG